MYVLPQLIQKRLGFVSAPNFQMPGDLKSFPASTTSQSRSTHTQSFFLTTSILIHNVKMTELAFAKSFLSSLDTKPTKISADHVEDPRSYPARSAVCPRPSLPPSNRPQTQNDRLTTPSISSPNNPTRSRNAKSSPPAPNPPTP